MSESCLPRAKPALVMLRARAQAATLMVGGIVLVWSVIDELASIVLVHRHQLAILTRSVGSRVRLFYGLPRKRIGGREQSAWQVGHAALVRAWAFFVSLELIIKHEVSSLYRPSYRDRGGVQEPLPHRPLSASPYDEWPKHVKAATM